MCGAVQFSFGLADITQRVVKVLAQLPNLVPIGMNECGLLLELPFQGGLREEARGTTPTPPSMSLPLITFPKQALRNK